MNIKNSAPSALFLDSGGGWHNESDKSFILFQEPEFSLCSKDGITTINFPNEEFTSRRNPIYLIEGFLTEGYVAVGYIGYEFSKFTEQGFSPVRIKDGYSFPNTYFLFFPDNKMVSGDIRDLKYILESSQIYAFPPNKKEKNPSSEPLRSNIPEDQYVTMVKRVKKYIESGDIYQVNLSQRFTATINLSPLSYFLNLYDVQPVPFGCYLDFGEYQLVSGSMELFLKKVGAKLSAKPIKGTRKRGYNEQDDAILKAELIGSDKERAENLMIVDLMRNDLGRVCEIGTVKVNKLFEIESYSTLHQMVSEVEGSARNDVGLTDIIKATFPPGSVTGAPKKRALEIIDEVEPHLRGPYCGAIGIFFPGGDFTLSVAIRVLTVTEREGTFWVGGGIVWDSNPKKEFEETLVKARAIKKALGVTE